MAARGYATVEAVADFLGKKFTPDQERMAHRLLEPVERYIDYATRSGGWLLPPVADERYELENVGSALYLRRAPVASVQRVVVRTHQVGDPGRTLLAGVDYELQDPQKGLVVLSAAYSTGAGYDGAAGSAGYTEAGRPAGGARAFSSFALVSYLPDRPLPAEIGLAARLLVAHWLIQGIRPEIAGLAAWTLNTQKLQAAEHVARGTIPQEVADILASHRVMIF